MNKYTEVTKLSKKLSEIADFREEFDRAFDGFVNNDLPKDELYYQIQAEMAKKEDQAKAKKDKNENLLGNSKVLPEVMDPADKIRRKLDERNGKNFSEMEAKDEAR